MSWEPLPGDRSTMVELSSALGRLHRTLGLARPDSVTALRDHWSALLGRELAPRATLESLRHDTLVIAVSDPAVAEHLRWAERDLVGAANSVCGGEVVRHVEVRIRSSLG